MTLRKVGVLVAGLPSDSLTMSALAPHMADAPEPSGPPRQWSTEAHLLASVIDAVGMLTHAYVQAHSKGNVGAYKPVPRPSDHRAKPTPARLTPQQRAEIDRRNRGGANGQ